MKKIMATILAIFFRSFIVIVEYWFFFLIAVLILLIFLKSINFFQRGFHKKGCIILLINFFIFFASWLFTGYIIYPFDDKPIPHFFLKKNPTFQLKFYDIYLQNGGIPKFENLSKKQKQRQINYCKYRYNIHINNDNELISCIRKIHPYTDVNNPNG